MNLVYNELLRENLQLVENPTPTPPPTANIVVDASTINNSMDNIDAIANQIVILTNISESQTISYKNATSTQKYIKGSPDFDIPFLCVGPGKFQLLIVPIL